MPAFETQKCVFTRKWVSSYDEWINYTKGYRKRVYFSNTLDFCNKCFITFARFIVVHTSGVKCNVAYSVLFKYIRLFNKFPITFASFIVVQTSLNVNETPNEYSHICAKRRKETSEWNRNGRFNFNMKSDKRYKHRVILIVYLRYEYVHSVNML